MDKLLAPQIEYLLILQNFREMTNGCLDNFFMFITSFGELVLPTLFVSYIYWCFNKKEGIFLLLNWSLGMVICQFLKLWACIYRPWILDTRIHPIPEAIKWAGGYSFPSGHTQTAVSVWGGAATFTKNKSIKYFFILIILLIGFSRNYIGVHTQQDVFVALFVGIILLIAVRKLLIWVDGGKDRDKLLLLAAYIISALLMFYGYVKSYPIDYLNGDVLVSPTEMKLYSLPKIGLLSGIFTGWYIERNYINFETNIGSILEKIIIFIFGTILLFGTSYSLSEGLNGLIDKRAEMFITTFISSIFITAIYPIFIKTYYKNKKQN